MRYIYFTKTLRSLDVSGLVAFCKDVGLDGVDLAVRPGYPVHPDNVREELPKAMQTFKDAGLTIGLVSTPTGLNDPSSKAAIATFEACGKAGVPAIKIGYFSYQGNYETGLLEARRRLGGFAKLAERTGVRCCYHTHSGNNYGNNCANLRALLLDLDPHHVGAFVDTGHVAINGGPFAFEVDQVRPWLSLIAIKDMLWHQDKNTWKTEVVPAGKGIVKWDEVAKGLASCKFDGTIVVHGEYEENDLSRRKQLGREELAFLKGRLRSK